MAAEKAEKVTKPTKVMRLHMAIGVDLIGSTTSLQGTKNYDLELGPCGVTAKSKKSGRVILIPFSNIKGMELFKD